MRAITTYLPTSAESAVSRRQLCEWTHLGDRDMREQIEKARAEGTFVVNFGKGYFISEDTTTLLRYYKQEFSRAMSILKRLKHIRRFLKEKDLL